MKKRFISFLFIIIFLINMANISYADKNDRYEKGRKIETLYNLVPIENNKNIKIKSEEVTYNLDTKYLGENGTVKTLVEMENTSNQEENIYLSLMVVTNMMDFNEILSDKNSKFKLNGENIDYKIKIGRLTNREYSSINPEINIEDIYDFDKERKNIVGLNYRPTNFELNEKVYFYKLSTIETNDKLDNDVEVNINDENDNFYIHNYLNFSKDDSEIKFIGSEEKYILSYKKPINDFKINDKKLIEGNNTVINKNGENINLKFSSVEITMKDALELINRENLPIELFENILDEQLKFNKNIISIYDLSSNMERIVFLDYLVKFKPKEVVKTLIITPINKSKEYTGDKDIYFDYVSNPSNKLSEIENFKFILKLGNEYNKFKGSNVKFKNIENNIYEFKTDKLTDNKITVNYGNKKLINHSTKTSLLVGFFIILIAILLLSILFFIYLIIKNSKKSNYS